MNGAGSCRVGTGTRPRPYWAFVIALGAVPATSLIFIPVHPLSRTRVFAAGGPISFCTERIENWIRFVQKDASSVGFVFMLGSRYAIEPREAEAA